jgi:2-keto-4-pentenoate hydratase/2-oxohepta-3-ene-1,7-dioic acid hydratase in catechol pathway
MLNLEDVSVKAPIPAPRRNIICVGKNYKDHILEVQKAGGSGEAAEFPKAPVFFTKAPETVIEPHGKVCLYL